VKRVPSHNYHYIEHHHPQLPPLPTRFQSFTDFAVHQPPPVLLRFGRKCTGHKPREQHSTSFLVKQPSCARRCSKAARSSRATFLMGSKCQKDHRGRRTPRHTPPALYQRSIRCLPVLPLDHPPRHRIHTLAQAQPPNMFPSHQATLQRRRSTRVNDHTIRQKHPLEGSRNLL
jgi:hypothetical protein